MKTLSLDIEPSLFERALEVMRSALKSVDKNATLSCDSDEYLSKADQEELKEIYELTKAGKMEFLSESELSVNLAKRGYEW